MVELKEDVAAQGNYICFEIIRDMMYKYSKKQQRKFMSNPLLAFLMVLFLESPEAIMFIKEKKMKRMDNNEFNEIKFKKIMVEVEDFKVQAK